MYNHFFNFSPLDISVIILSAIGGIAIVSFFKNSFYRFLLTGVIIVIIVISLYRGYSVGLESITYNLAYYISANPVGLVGLVIGILIGIIMLKRRKE